MKLEIKHIAPYAIHGVGIHHEGKWIGDLTGFEYFNSDVLDRRSIKYQQDILHFGTIPFEKFESGECKLLLKPLSELMADNETIEKLEAIEKRDLIISIKYKDVIESEGHYLLDNITYKNLQVLLENHYDVFGLIDNGLAEVKG